MKNSISKTKMTATIAIVLLMASVTLMVMPVQAQWYIDNNQYGMGWWGTTAKNLQPNGGQRLPSGVTPDVVLKMDAYLSFRPNPVGVGQPILVNIWTVPGPSFVRYFTDYKVTFTKPDGTKDVITLDSYFADSTAWLEYVVDQVGTWKIKFEVPGQYFPPGNYTMPAGTTYGNLGYTDSYTRSCYYKPASTTEQTLIVRSEMVYSWPESPLPTDYWTRPIVPENREWWTIAGHYPWHGPGGGTTWDKLYPNTSPYWSGSQRFTPWVQGPNTAHIVWKRPGPGVISGLHGGDQGYASLQVGGGNPTIIYQGRAYQTVTKEKPTWVNGTVRTLPVSVWQCYDIRTGEVYWELTDVTAPTVIEYSRGLPAVPGAEAAVGVTASLVAITTTRLIKYSPATGAVTVNVSIPTMTTTEYYMNGYALSVQTISTTGGPGAFGTSKAGIYRLINWTTFGTTTNFTERIQSNISWPMNNLGNFASLRDYETGIVFRVEETSWFDTPVTGFPWAYIPYDNATGIRYGTRIQAYSLKKGEMLWDKSFYESVYHPTASAAQFGKLAVLMQDQEGTGGGYYMCFDSYSGKLLWKSEQMEYPWDVPGFGAYSICTAYGMIFRFGYSGVYAFDWETGKIVWKYEAPAFSAYETPYTDAEGNTMYSFNAGGWVADGKIYVQNTEHTPSQPITRGWGVHCINATTGELIWKIKTPGPIGPIADGYMSVSCTDGYQYVFGKGKSKTTVTAPDTVIPKGTGIVIRGTVLDMSPAQPGTPCVSKESMTTQMEYLHRQMPINGLWGNETITGVPVTLCAIDSKGNTIDIGTVTTNGYYGTFSCAWTPPDEGDYTIIASFAGDDSYGSSAAATAVTVGPAPEPYPEPIQPEPPIDNTPTIIGTGIAIIIAVATATILILRKRP